MLRNEEPPRAAVSPGSWALRGLFLMALLLFVQRAQALFAPVLIALTLTFVFAPAVRALRRRGVPEFLGAGLLVVALLGSTVPVAAVLAEPAATWWQRAPATLDQLLLQLDRLRAALPGGKPAAAHIPTGHPAGIGGSRVVKLPPAPAVPAVDPVKDRLASEGLALTGVLLGQSVHLLLSTAATVILLYFLLISERWILSRWLEALPRVRTRALVLAGLRAAQRDIARYVWAVTTINIGVGVVMAVLMQALGLPNPALWGAVAAVLNFVPYLGPLLIFCLLLLAGSFSFVALPDMLAPAVTFMLVHAFESTLLSPWIVGRRLAMNPLSVILSVMLWGWLWGIAGALIAVPLLIALRSLCRRNRRLQLVAVYLESGKRPCPSLYALLNPAAGTDAPPDRRDNRLHMPTLPSDDTAAGADRPAYAASRARLDTLDAVPPGIGLPGQSPAVGARP